VFNRNGMLFRSRIDETTGDGCGQIAERHVSESRSEERESSCQMVTHDV
jgi:hypothetical protein